MTVTVTDSTGASVSVSFTWRVANIYANSTRVWTSPTPAAVQSPITVTGRTGNASATTQVYVKIIHTYRGDLTVSLVGPDDRLLAPEPQRRQRRRRRPDLHVDASAQPVNGTWKLRVQDTAAIDVGYIQQWQLTPDLSARRPRPSGPPRAVRAGQPSSPPLALDVGCEDQHRDVVSHGGAEP